MTALLFPILGVSLCILITFMNGTRSEYDVCVGIDYAFLNMKYEVCVGIDWRRLR